jgi:hypothetical protein
VLASTEDLHKHTYRIDRIKAFRTFIRVDFLFKSESFGGKIKWSLHKSLIGSAIIFASLHHGSFGRYESFDVAASANHVLLIIRNFPVPMPIHNLLRCMILVQT